MGTLKGFPNPPALWLRRAKPAYAYAIMGTPRGFCAALAGQQAVGKARLRGGKGQSNSPTSKCSVRGAIDGGDRGCCAGPDHRHGRDVVEGDATNGDHRDVNHCRNFLQGGQADRRVRVGLGLRPEHRTETNIVRPPGHGGLGLFEVVGRDADGKRVRAGRASNAQYLGQRQVALSQVNGIGADRQSRVQAIVHTQRNMMLGAQPPQGVSQFAQPREAELLCPQLQAAWLGREKFACMTACSR